jgi:hypothetical protein
MSTQTRTRLPCAQLVIRYSGVPRVPSSKVAGIAGRTRARGGLLQGVLWSPGKNVTCTTMPFAGSLEAQPRGVGL